MRKLMAAVVFIVAARAAASATPIWGMAESTCRHYASLPAESAEAEAHVQWISGYVIGKTFAVASVYEVPTIATVETLRTWLKEYCVEKPESGMSDAAEAFLSAYKFPRRNAR